MEAGLRSFDRSMPEEINRLITDRLTDLFFVTEESAIDNLVREGIDPACIRHVGNVMIDTLRDCLERAVPARETLRELGLAADRIDHMIRSGFGFVTLHRPSNVDDPVSLEGLLAALHEISRKVPLVFPLHPRTRAMIAKSGLDTLLCDAAIVTTQPLGYLRALGLMREARLAITDSGGVQEETTALGVPCLTVRRNTERPTTVEQGTNRLVGTSPATLIAAAADVLANGGKRGRVPALWDGRAATRIAHEIDGFLTERRRAGTA